MISAWGLFAQETTPFYFKPGTSYKISTLLFFDSEGKLTQSIDAEDQHLYLIYRSKEKSFMFMAYYYAGHKKVSDILVQYTGSKAYAHDNFSFYHIDYTLIGNPEGSVNYAIFAYNLDQSTAVVQIYEDNGSQYVPRRGFLISKVEYRDIISFPIQFDNDSNFEDSLKEFEDSLKNGAPTFGLG